MVEGSSGYGLFSDFYAAEYGRLVGALRLACGGRSDAEDVAQEAMVRACLHWKRVREMDRPAGWLYVTAFNLVRRERRRKPAPQLTPPAAAVPEAEHFDVAV